MNQNLSFNITPTVDDIPNPLFSGDFNGDGIIDTARIQRNSKKIFITLGNGEEKEVVTQGQPIKFLIDDFNGDGLDDIIFQQSISSNSQEISLLLGNANGQFQSPVNIASDSILNFAIVNIDDNDLPDLLTINREDNQNIIQVLQNQANNNFVKTNELTTTNSFNSSLAIIEDLDNDGIKDIVNHNHINNSVNIFFGQENGEFQEDKSYAVGDNVSQVIVKDLNGDGSQDIVTVNTNNFPNTSNLSILINDGNGNFIASESREKPEDTKKIFYSDRFVGDFNGDGLEDVAGTIPTGPYYYDSYELFVAFGQEDGSFAEPADTGITLPGGAYRGGIVQVGDFNGDRFDDLVLSDTTYDDNGSPYGSTKSLLISGGNGSFTRDNSFFEGNNIPNKLEDLNNDGIDDWLSLDNNSNTLSVTIAQGNLQFEDTVEYSINHDLDQLEIADFNNDDFNDVAITDLENGKISILFNQGNGNLGNSLTYDVATNSSIFKVEDITGDNISDIILHNNFTISVLRGQVNNSFQNTVSTTVTDFISNDAIAIGDFNSDGLGDIVVSQNQGLTVLLQQSNGIFQQSVDSILGYRPHSIIIEDFNNDNILDIQADNAILLGQGDGSFLTTPLMNFPRPLSSVAVEDFDNDNILDIVAVGERTASLFTGKGDGSFNNSVDFETRITGDYIAIDDVNNDGRLDVIIGNDSSSEQALLINNPATGFIAQPRVNLFSSRTATRDFNFSDFNNDGVIDFVGVNDSNEVGIAISQGDGGYETTVTQIAEGYSSQFIELGDFNGDRITDIIAISSANNQNEISVLLGQGNGEFNSSVTSQVAAQITDIVTGDFNGDGITDLAISNGKNNNSIPGEVLILEGKTDGSFKNPIRYEVGISPQDIIVADIDGDGIQDLATANNRGGDVSLLLGKADGTFNNVQSVAVANPPGGISGLDRSSLKVGDFNGDSIADLAVEVRNPDNKGINILLGDGNGNFQQTASESSQNLLEVADFNDDGLSDLILSDNDITFSVLLSTGNGNFATALEFAAGNFNRLAKVSPIKAGDFNQDGIQDLALKSFGDISLVINNTPNNILGNTPPAVMNDDVITDKDTIATGNVLDNDSDFNGDRLTVTAINGNANNIGQEITLDSGVLLTLNSNGSFSYNPNSQFDNLFVNEQATDSFAYTVTDSKGITGIATVKIVIQGFDDPNVITGTNRDDTLIGDSQDNIIRGLGSHDLLEGKDGADTLYGGFGKDTLIGGKGDDFLEGGLDNDSLEGNEGQDTLIGDYANDALRGGSGDDVLQGGNNEDFLAGDSGNDTLDGGQGRDRLDGGLGNDRLIGGTERDSFVLRKGDGTDTIVDFIADLNRGQSDRFFLPYGLKVTDFDLVRNGNNTEIRFASTNEIVSIVENVLPEEIGKGNFITETRYLYGTNDNDTLNGGIGNDHISVYSGDDLVRGNQGNDTIYASSGNDTIFGNQGNDLIEGSLGNDSLLGGENSDTLIGNEGEDTLKGQAGNDSLEGNEDNDLLFGNNGDDTLNGGSGNDELRGDLGNDSLIGDTGNDRLLGFDGNDTLQGKADNDFLDGGAGSDRLFGNNGNDFLQGSLGNDTLRGDRGEDILVGGSGNDNLVGGAENDVLRGQSNDDFLDGADGLDTLIGGGGRDRFFLRVGAGTDIIVDFENNLDKFVLGHNLNFDQLSLVANGSDTEIQVITTEETIAVVNNTSPNNLDITDFV